MKQVTWGCKTEKITNNSSDSVFRARKVNIIGLLPNLSTKNAPMLVPRKYIKAIAVEAHPAVSGSRPESYRNLVEESRIDHKDTVTCKAAQLTMMDFRR